MLALKTEANLGHQAAANSSVETGCALNIVILAQKHIFSTKSAHATVWIVLVLDINTQILAPDRMQIKVQGTRLGEIMVRESKAAVALQVEQPCNAIKDTYEFVDIITSIPFWYQRSLLLEKDQLFDRRQRELPP